MKKMLRKQSVAITVLIISTLLVYYPSLFNGFVTVWDDGWQIHNSYTINISWENILAIMTEFYKGQYSPLNQLMYNGIYHFLAPKAYAFHIVCLCLHLGSGLLVYGIIKRLSNYRIAFGVALLFLIHPLQVESVAWISASKILLYAFFYLAGIRLYILYLDTGKKVYYFLTLCAFVLSFGGKEQAVTFPVCLLFVDLIMKRDFRSFKLWNEKIIFFIFTFAFAYITLRSHGIEDISVLANKWTFPFYQRIAFAAYAYTEYIVKILFPINLLYLYPFPMAIGEPIPFRFWSYPIGWLCILLVLKQYWLKKPILYGMLFYTLSIALTVHIVPMSRVTIIADRYVYLASIGLFYILVYYFDLFIVRTKILNNRFIILVLVYFVLLGGYAHYRTYTWYNNTTLKTKVSNLMQQQKQLYENVE